MGFCLYRPVVIISNEEWPGSSASEDPFITQFWVGYFWHSDILGNTWYGHSTQTSDLCFFPSFIPPSVIIIFPYSENCSILSPKRQKFGLSYNSSLMFPSGFNGVHRAGVVPVIKYSHFSGSAIVKSSLSSPQDRSTYMNT